MKAYKVFAVITVCAFAIFTGSFATAKGINIISQTHYVQGGIWLFRSEDGLYDEYNTVDTNPVSGMISLTPNSGYGACYGDASSSAGDFQVSAAMFNIDTMASALAESTYVFTPLAEMLTITVDGHIGEWSFENRAQISFLDLTNGTVLESYTSPSFTVPPLDAGFPIYWEKTYQVDQSHQYQLWMYVSAQRGEGGSGNADLSVNISPEPMTLLLLGLGTIVLRQKIHVRIK